MQYDTATTTNRNAIRAVFSLSDLYSDRTWSIIVFFKNSSKVPVGVILYYNLYISHKIAKYIKKICAF